MIDKKNCFVLSRFVAKKQKTRCCNSFRGYFKTLVSWLEVNSFRSKKNTRLVATSFVVCSSPPPPQPPCLLATIFFFKRQNKQKTSREKINISSRFILKHLEKHPDNYSKKKPMKKSQKKSERGKKLHPKKKTKIRNEKFQKVIEK